MKQEIKVRAMKFCMDIGRGSLKNTHHAFHGYIAGSTDQRKIDIDLVRSWLCDHVIGTTLTEFHIKALTKAMEG